MIKTTIYNNVRNDFKVKFIATSTNWGTLTTIDAWKTILAGQLGVGNPFLIKNFKFENNTVSFCLIAKSNFTFDLQALNLTFVDFLGLEKTTGLYLPFNQLTNFNPLKPLSSHLTELELQQNQLTSFDTTYPLPNSLVVLTFNNNQLTNFNPTQLLPNSLQVLNLHINQFTSFNFTNPLPNSLRFLSLHTNQLTNLTITNPLPNSLWEFYLHNNSFTSLVGFPNLPSTLILLRMDSNLITTAGWTSSEAWATAQPETTSCTINLGGNTNSASGTTFASILISKGYTLIY